MEQWIMEKAMQRADEGDPPMALVLPTSAWKELMKDLKELPLRGHRDAKGDLVQITLHCSHGNLIIAEDPEARIHDCVGQYTLDA